MRPTNEGMVEPGSPQENAEHNMVDPCPFQGFGRSRQGDVFRVL
jgi:hypothetical protein